jgi:N-methylhydantoinase A
MRVGIEVGGTFTDLVAFARDRVRIAKVPSTPASPELGAFAALAAAGIDLAEVEDLVHGSTVATNAVLERKGARLAFVTTAGFRDLLTLQRHDRRQVYDLAYQRPAPLVRRRDCYEVRERMLADGTPAIALDRAAAERDLLPALREGGYEAIAICLLNSYANPAHERELAALIRAGLGDVWITVSADVSQEMREYERASTTVLSAYVQPVIDRYIDRFERRLHEQGFRGRFSVMQSNGGALPAQATRENAITALYSGPAAGVVGVGWQVGRSGFRDLITFDMGGTSTDVSIIERGQCSLAAETEIDGLPIRTPVLDIVTVGAGGGSLVWRDEGGMLRVGPQSAGAVPGPACYDRGGAAPTVTDAHLLRGTLQADTFLGGTMRLDEAAAAAAFRGLAEAFGQLEADVADSAIRLANANIVRAVQVVSTQRGRDPRNFVLVPFGGAGPLHAAEVAGALGIETIVVPPNPGVMSAYGLLAADDVRYVTRTRHAALDGAAPDTIRRAYEEMRAALAASLGSPGPGGSEAEFTLCLDMRFKGQAFEVPVEMSTSEMAAMTAASLEAAFLSGYEAVYAQQMRPGRAIEIVALRAGARQRRAAAGALRDAGVPNGVRRKIRIVFEGRRIDAVLLPLQDLADGRPVQGPAVLQSETSSIFVAPGWRGAVDEARNFVMRRSER